MSEAWKMTLFIAGMVAIVLFFMFGMPWVIVLVSQNACEAYRWAGPAFHREALWMCEGKLP